MCDLHDEKFTDGGVQYFEDTIPFELTAGWVWSKIDPLGKYITGGSRDWAQYYSNAGNLFFRMGNLSRNAFGLRVKIIVTYLKYITLTMVFARK